MISSAKIQERIINYMQDYENHSVQEIKAILQQNGMSDYTEGQFAGSINTLLRNGTIRKIDRGVYALNPKSENMKKCFVVSPIGEENSEIRSNADKLFKYVIKPVCEACEFDPIRVDKLNDANSITQTIIEHLETADLVIADMTGHNANVFYGMGYRARTKKPMIHLRKKGESLPFDVNTIRALEYDLTDLDSVEEVKERLIKTIETFTYSESNEASETQEASESSNATIIPILYEILDLVKVIRGEVKNLSNDTITTLVQALKPTQPQVSSETALQMQLINSFAQNPEGFMKLIELSNLLGK